MRPCPIERTRRSPHTLRKTPLPRATLDDDATSHDTVHADDDDDDEEHHHALPHDFKPHESPWVDDRAARRACVLSTVGGLVGIPYAVSSLFGAGDVNVFEAHSRADHRKGSARSSILRRRRCRQPRSDCTHRDTAAAAEHATDRSCTRRT